MNQSKPYTTSMKTIFNRHHHYMLMGICLLFLAISMIITGCDINDSNNDNEPDRPSFESSEITPVGVFIENENKEAPNNPDAKLYETRAHQPVMTPDGRHIPLQEFQKPQGSFSAQCLEGGTRVTLEVSGLIPNGVYTMWNVVFKAPGFDPTFEHETGFGAMGPADGTENSFLASVDGKGAISILIPEGELSQGGQFGDCGLEDHFEWYAVGAYHMDSQTHGPEIGPAGTAVEQFAFIHKQEDQQANNDHRDWDCLPGEQPCTVR